MPSVRHFKPTADLPVARVRFLTTRHQFAMTPRAGALSASTRAVVIEPWAKGVTMSVIAALSLSGVCAR